MNSLLLLAGVCIFIAGRLYESAKREYRRLSDFDDGYKAGLEDREHQQDELRDKKEVSLNMIREDMGFGGDWK